MKLSVRMVLSMTILDLAESRGLMKVSLFTSLSNVAADFLSEGLPQEVSIPRYVRYLYVYVCMCTDSSKMCRCLLSLSAVFFYYCFWNVA